MASIDPHQRAFDEAKLILEILIKAGFQAMLAGGCVRDRLLGTSPKDYDVATDALPDQVTRCLSGKLFKVIPTGIDHGTVTAVGKFSSTEITTLRGDLETDGRKALVVFGKSFKEDAARRDFTINAMYEDINGQIYDYWGGKEDLRQARLRFVGDAAKRIEEDYLRTLRLIRFHSRLGFAIDSPTVQAVARHASGLRRISQERITSEIWGILEGKWVQSGLSYLVSTETFGEVFKGFSTPTEDICARIGGIDGQGLEQGILSEMRMAFLLSSLRKNGLHPSEKEVEHFLRGLKASRQEIQRVEGFFELLHWNDSPEIDVKMEFLDRLEAKGIPLASFSSLVAAVKNLGQEKAMSELLSCEISLGYLRRAKVPVTGHELIGAFALSPGKELGDLLDKLKRSFRRQEWSTPQEGMAVAKKLLGRKEA